MPCCCTRGGAIGFSEKTMILKQSRLRRAHRKFLEASRSLRDGKDYWDQAGNLKKGCLQLLVPVPLISLNTESAGLLSALAWLEENCRTKLLDEGVLRHYHKLVCQNGGSYRNVGMSIKGTELGLPPPARIAGLMQQLGAKLTDQQQQLDKEASFDTVLGVAVEVHYHIGMIHPYTDGNGRVARLAMNHLLRRYDQGYVIYPPLGEGSPLWHALKGANDGSMAELVRLAKRCLLRI